MTQPDARRTIGASDNPAVLGGVRAKNNGRYNGNGRHWRTPPEVFDPLHAEFDFTLDPCATAESAKCAKFYTEADNGLAQSWAGERVFMNPPYGAEIYAWTKKAREEAAKGALVVGLLPASTDLAWWHDDVVGHAEVRYLRGRVRFLTDGPYRASGFFSSVIVVWRPSPRLKDKMTEMKHTPGPWEAVEDEYVSHDAAGYEQQISSGGIMGGTPDDPVWVVYGEIEYKPDAYLIAAAPDMIDALRQWQWAEQNGDAEELENARYSRDAAIAKAKGTNHG